ncbi:MAG: SCO family protein [Oceanospirillaceae bacterium]|nr:SCO family protein [Oceanospirillaceae bacterium]
MKSSKIFTFFVLIIAMFLGVFSYLNFNKTPASIGDQLGGDFSVTLEDGQFKLEDYRDKVVLLYFGYASCPDVCPTALALTGNILKKLPQAIAAQIQPLFISVDPDRDDLKKLTLYGHYFHPNMLAGTDTKEKLDKLVRKYGAFYSINNQENSAMGYSVDHTSRLYIIDKNGKLADTLSHADIQPNLANKLLLLTEK